MPKPEYAIYANDAVNMVAKDNMKSWQNNLAKPQYYPYDLFKVKCDKPDYFIRGLATIKQQLLDLLVDDFGAIDLSDDELKYLMDRVNSNGIVMPRNNALYENIDYEKFYDDPNEGTHHYANKNVPIGWTIASYYSVIFGTTGGFGMEGIFYSLDNLPPGWTKNEDGTYTDDKGNKLSESEALAKIGEYNTSVSVDTSMLGKGSSGLKDELIKQRAAYLVKKLQEKTSMNFYQACAFTGHLVGESSLDTGAKSATGATGINQWTGVAIKSLNSDLGTNITKADIAAMSFEDQVELVIKIFNAETKNGKLKNLWNEWNAAGNNIRKLVETVGGRWGWRAGFAAMIKGETGNGGQTAKNVWANHEKKVATAYDLAGKSGDYVKESH